MKSWEEIAEAGIEMDYKTVVYPFVDEEKLSRIYVNVESSVLKDFNGNARSSEGVKLAERNYISRVYFHTLFLFATTKSRKYEIQRGDGEQRGEIDLADYVSDLFSSSYAQFLLSFETRDLVDAVG